ncbi:hypothetical protein EDD11_003128 [Mortierella claussenii]|nr:hypothetical protein EDD11_003128 [Mortierella claussenii]
MSSSSSTSPTVPTNTLTITDLDNHHFDEQSTFLSSLRAQTELFGQVCFFSPIKSFHRVFVVYQSVFDAQRAKALLHNTRFQGITLRVYFGQHTELSIDPERYYLHLPEKISKTATEPTGGLISPPGSPPVGYVDDEEMEAVEDDFSLYQGLSSALSSSLVSVSTERSLSSSVDMPEVSIATLVSDTTESINGRLHQQINKLRIDTLLTPSSMTSGHSPRSPITPTRLAFSPAKGSQGEQPFITIQDWGVCA